MQHNAEVGLFTRPSSLMNLSLLAWEASICNKRSPNPDGPVQGIVDRRLMILDLWKSLAQRRRLRRVSPLQLNIEY
jgi:hypothetical protein